MFTFLVNFIPLGKWKPFLSENPNCIHQFKAVRRMQKTVGETFRIPATARRNNWTPKLRRDRQIGGPHGRVNGRASGRADERSDERVSGRTFSSAILEQLPSGPRIQKLVIFFQQKNACLVRIPVTRMSFLRMYGQKQAQTYPDKTYPDQTSLNFLQKKHLAAPPRSPQKNG